MILFGFSEFFTQYVINVFQVPVGVSHWPVELFQSIWLRKYPSNPCLIDGLKLLISLNFSPPFWETLCRGFAGLDLSACIKGRFVVTLPYSI
jgi:hypothetical protein